MVGHDLWCVATDRRLGHRGGQMLARNYHPGLPCAPGTAEPIGDFNHLPVSARCKRPVYTPRWGANPIHPPWASVSRLSGLGRSLTRSRRVSDDKAGLSDPAAALRVSSWSLRCALVRSPSSSVEFLAFDLAGASANLLKLASRATERRRCDPSRQRRPALTTTKTEKQPTCRSLIQREDGPEWQPVTLSSAGLTLLGPRSCNCSSPSKIQPSLGRFPSPFSGRLCYVLFRTAFLGCGVRLHRSLAAGSFAVQLDRPFEPCPAEDCRGRAELCRRPVRLQLYMPAGARHGW